MQDKREAKSDVVGVDPKRLRKFKRTMILKEPEVRLLAAAVRKALGVPLTAMVESSGLSFEDNVRFGSVQAKCVEIREAMGKSIRDVALELKVPQYRLKDIESSRLRDIDASILDGYVSYLGIKPWFRRWSKANEELASRLSDTRSTDAGRTTKKK